MRPFNEISWVLSAPLSLLVLAIAISNASAYSSFTPALSVSSGSHIAGSTPGILSIQISKERDISSQKLQSVALRLPAGLVPSLKGVGYCDLVHVDGSYRCTNKDARIGALLYSLLARPLDGSGGISDLQYSADIYLERPRAGEAARILALSEDMASEKPIESSVKLAATGSDVTFQMEDLPLSATINGIPQEVNFYELSINLDGSAVKKGTPLLTNPTICNPGNGFEASFTSFGEDDVADDGPFGDDITVARKAHYEIEGCDHFPFNPNLSLVISDQEAGKPTSLNTSFSLAEGDASARSISIVMPSQFNLNPDAQRQRCSDREAAAFNCPSSSRLGQAQATSNLVDRPLQAGIYLAYPSDDRARVLLIFEGQFAFRIEGFIDKSADGGLEISFPNFPPLPLSQVEMKLDGGGAGLMLNPFSCGTYWAKSTFSSHTGLSSSVSGPIDITGCKSKPAALKTSFEAEVTPARVKRFIDLSLHVSKSPPVRIDSVRFVLPKGLKLAPPKRIPRRKVAGYFEAWDSTPKAWYGPLRFAPPSGRKYYSKLRSSKKSLKGLKVSLEKKQRSILVTKLPEGALTDFTVRLWGRQQRLLRSPSSCSRPLRFRAEITVDRVAEIVEDTVPIKCDRTSKR